MVLSHCYWPPLDGFFEFIFVYLVRLSFSSATSKNVGSGGFPWHQATTPEADKELELVSYKLYDLVNWFCLSLFCVFAFIVLSL